VEHAPGLGLGVAWSRDASTNEVVVVQRYGYDLAPVGDALVISEGSDDARTPVLAWDGSAFGVAWERNTAVGDSDVLFSRVGCP
jgi:hypothetical protein